MVSKSLDNQKNNSTQGLRLEEFKVFQTWKRPIQQALTLEAESGFNNLYGRTESFHSFVSRSLSSPPQFLPKICLEKITDQAQGFIDYPDASENDRRRLVIDLRKYLHTLSCQYDKKINVKSPRINLNKQIYFNSTTSTGINHSLTLNSPLADVSGIGAKFAAKLSSLGIFNVRDLLTYYPRDYVDYSSLRRISELELGETATIVATVRRCGSFTSPRNRNLSVLDLQVQDPTGRLKVTRFFAGRRFSNKSYLKTQEKLYPPGAIVAISGLVKESSYGKSFTDPVIEVLDSFQSSLKSKTIGRLMPIYSLTDGISTTRFRGFLESVTPMLSLWPDPLPLNILKSLSLPTINKALKQIHWPDDNESLKTARRRLVFDEFFIFQLSLLLRRQKLKKHSAPSFLIDSRPNELVKGFLDSLPFKLTKAQNRVLAEIDSDLLKTEPMSRLVQGDVGSGKTVVATAALLNAVQAGWQGALMAPTEVLAEQHYKNLCNWLPNLHVTVDLLTGSTSRVKRRRILDDLNNGSLKIIVGTHALLEGPVSFSRLGLVVVDEQHRFGVRQRNLLLNKGLQPHLLTMTATPIPRTLALSLHGDLDVSQIDELPPGRTQIITRLLSRNQIHQAYQLIRDQIAKGQQAYVVLPLVDESEKLDLRSAIKVHDELSNQIFPNLSVGLLHGRMNAVDKQRVIEQFLLRKFNILVSTTVVEVGVDVPNATVMLVDNADRFGLAQLHQLRGRVGRGSIQSHCIFIYNTKNKEAKQRLDVLANCSDGFEISEIDLRLRGPGQVLGTKQSGLPDFALASLINDAEILELARQQAIILIEQDPELQTHILLKKLVKKNWERISDKAHLN